MPDETELNEPTVPDEKVRLETQPTIVDADLSFTDEAESSESSYGRFHNLELLGEGGIGQVLQAHDPTLGRPTRPTPVLIISWPGW